MDATGTQKRSVVSHLSDPFHTLEVVGSWPFHLVSLSSYVRCILDMGLDTYLKVVPMVVATLNQPRKKLSYKIVEMEYKWKPVPFDYVRCESLFFDPL